MRPIRSLFVTLTLAAALTCAAVPLHDADARGPAKFRHRLQSGVQPFEDGDQVRVLLTNTTERRQRAVIVVQQVGTNGQLDAAIAEERTLEARTVAELTHTLTVQDGLRLHMVEVLAGHAGVMATTQHRRTGVEVAGRGLAHGDFLRTRGRFPDPTD